MCKKIFCTIIIFILVLTFSIPAMAYPAIDAAVAEGMLNNSLTEAVQAGQEEGKDEKEEDPFERLLAEIIKDPDIEETEQFLAEVSISNDNILGITGVLKKDVAGEKSVWGVLAIYNKEENIYEEYKNTSDEGRWIVGDSGVFIKGFQLKTGEYQLKVMMFKKPLKEILSKNKVEGFLNSLQENLYTNFDPVEMSYNNSIYNEENNEDTIEEVKLELSKNMQVSYYRVNVLDEVTKQKLVKSDVRPMDTQDVLKRILVGK